MHADGHIAHDADLHAGLTCRLLGRMHLLDRNPLEPTVEFEQVAVLLAQLLDLGESFVYLLIQLSGVFSGLPHFA